MPIIRSFYLGLLILIFFLGVQPVRADNLLSFFGPAQLAVSQKITTVDGLVSLYLPAASLAGSSRVTFIDSQLTPPAEAIYPVYVWQVLDADIIKPLELSFVDQRPDLPFKEVVYRNSNLSTWSELPFKTDGNKLIVEINDVYGQITVIGRTVVGTSVFLDQETVRKGFPVKTKDDNFNFYIISEAITQPVQVDINPVPSGSYELPEGLVAVSPIYHFKISGDDNLTINKNLAIDIGYDGNKGKAIYYWNNLSNVWEKSPSWLRAGNKIRTYTHQRELVLVVLANKKMSEGVASWYRWQNGDFVASPDYTKGTKLKVTNLDNNKTVIVTVNDYGPDRSVHPDRVIDLDYVAFQKIANPRVGLIKVFVEEYHE